MPGGSIVTGEIVFDDSAPAFSGATVRVRLEDVSRADAPAIEAARLVVPNVAHAPGGAPLSFSLAAVDLRPGRDYLIRVHVDMDGSEPVASGDQITMESFSVSPELSRNHVAVRVRRVA